MSTRYLAIILVIFPSFSFAEVICFTPKPDPNVVQLVPQKEICIDVGDGSGEPKVVSGGGDCGGNASCAGNNLEILEKYLEYATILQKMQKDSTIRFQQQLQR